MIENASGDVIPWPITSAPPTLDIRDQVTNIIAIFRAIDAGELLAALPECAIARAQHMTALVLLKLAEKELVAVQDFLAR